MSLFKAETRLVVHVDEANKHAPRLMEEDLSWLVTEGQVGQEKTLRAEHHDQGLNSEIVFRILSGNEDGAFELVNSTWNSVSS